MRAIVANLDCELEWAQSHSPGPHRQLPVKVQSAVSRFSQSAAVLGNEDDRLLTVEQLRAAGSDIYSDCQQVLVWGQTLSHRGRASRLDEDAPWKKRLWQLVCEPNIAAECNDRGFCLGLDLPPELCIPDVRIVSTLRELDAYLADTALGPEDAWVAKAPWSASGRERLKRRGRALDGEQREFARRLLDRYGRLLIEPWMKRIDDFGVAGLVGDALESSLVFPAHQLRCDSGGVFRGIRIDDEQTRAKLGTSGDSLLHCADIVTRSLHQRGYRGPFGIDSFLYDDGGKPKLRAVCEINARITFGHVARALADAEGLLTCDFLPQC